MRLDDKLQHKMFWNWSRWSNWERTTRINFNIRCFEIDARINIENSGFLINFNIRCFEIGNKTPLLLLLCDKLQHKMFWNSETCNRQAQNKLINFNIRCFEMREQQKKLKSRLKINFNIRCFEIISWKRLL